jgi:hypothetical protein
MVMNYRETGRAYAKGKFAKGVALVNSFVNSLHKQGILPTQFPNNQQAEQFNPVVTQEPVCFEVEIASLESNVRSINQALSTSNKDVLKGFRNLRMDLAKSVALEDLLRKYTPIESALKLFAENVVREFEKTVELYKNSSKKPIKIRPSGKVKVYQQLGEFNPRQMRVLIFGYGLLPNQSKKSDKILAQEEEVVSVYQIKQSAQMHLAWAIGQRNSRNIER